jgi:phytoene dehydrogenase-like protein
MSMRSIRLAAYVLMIVPALVRADPGDWSATVYGARISTQPGWEDILIDSAGTEFVDSYLLTAAVSRQYAERYDGALAIEAEGQIVRHFGDQTHWELNAVPVVLRWSRFPWSRRFASSAAFGLGLSYATEMPPVEVALEGESRQWLVYWVMELTAGPNDAPWALSLRLHHRSVAYGLMGEEGGMNAVGLGLRFRF